jgi:branched-chain amino acid aminotransferase
VIFKKAIGGKKMEITRYCYLDGKIVPIEQGKLSLFSSGFKYGAAVFEGIRAYWNKDQKNLYVFRLKEHSERLLRSLKLMRFDHSHTVESLSRPVIDLLKANRFREDTHILQHIYVEGPGVGFMGDTGPTKMCVAAFPKGRYSDYEEGGGIACCVSSWARISDHCMPPRIKCTANYQNSRLALLEAKTNGYDSAILLNSHGKVAEGPAACLFIIRDGIPTTPPVSAGLLESITRDTIIRLFGETLQLNVDVRETDRTELYVAAEAFFCGSGEEVTPICTIDRQPLGNGRMGPITEAIRESYFGVVRGEDPRFSSWITPVYDLKDP